MKFIDLHCDTLMVAYINNKDNMFEMPGMLDLKRMKEGGQLAQFFAIFMLPEGFEEWIGRDEPIDDEEYLEYSFKAYENTLAMNSDIIAPALNAADILANEEAGKMSAILTIEDGRTCHGKLDNIKNFYDKGVRLMTLLWNDENCFGYPNSKDPIIMNKGLKDFGKEAVEYMNDLGMLIDVSHLSDGGFWDVAEISKKPFIASHSNSRLLSPHQRNLTDDMLRKLADVGGLAGINFGPEFLNEDLTVKLSSVDLMAKHIHHMINVAGIDSIALGSDFDGISGEFEVGGPQEVNLIFDRLKKDGLSESDIEKIAWRNALRVMEDVM